MRTAVTRACDNEFSVDWNTLRIFYRRRKPCDIGILRMRRHRKTERKRLRVNTLPARGIIARTVHAAVMLHPHNVGIRTILYEPMRILNHGIFGALLGHVIGMHADATRLPIVAAIVRLPDTAARYGDSDVLTIAQIE